MLTNQKEFLTFFGAKKEAKKHPPHPRPSPIWEGCNRSSCRSYILVSSTHQRVGMFFIDYARRWSINAGRLYERRLGPSARLCRLYEQSES